ncbi:MAG TPA: DedA family protein [Thermodesulfobacteriota bacterium]|nr:DedA family protein [Thermodesulfobacteriota bacterium]
MINSILTIISIFIIDTISSTGYLGIVILMAIESACIPLPSEVIMPFSGYLVSMKRFTLIGTGVAGAFGCVVGSVAAYYVGIYGGRPLIERYGKYILISHKDLDIADRWFLRYGDAVIFFSRLLPVIRTFISFPAGVARMNMVKFVTYTFVGSFPWCLGLAYIGMILGKNWEIIKVYFHRFDYLIGAVILLGIGIFLWKHLKRNRES